MGIRKSCLLGYPNHPEDTIAPLVGGSSRSGEKLMQSEKGHLDWVGITVTHGPPPQVVGDRTTGNMCDGL